MKEKDEEKQIIFRNSFTLLQTYHFVLPMLLKIIYKIINKLKRLKKILLKNQYGFTEGWKKAPTK
jgi:hypothetical protein